MRVMLFHGSEKPVFIVDLVDHFATDGDPTTAFKETPVVNVDNDGDGFFTLYTEGGHLYIVLSRDDMNKILEAVGRDGIP